MDINKGRKLLADYKFQSSYAKYIDNLNRKETWDESVKRVMDMHRLKLNDVMSNELEDKIQLAEQLYKDKLILGSQRALQFGGAPILKHEAKMFNCITGYVDRIEFFNECMYWLLCGCGVGFSVQKCHTNKLPDIESREKGVKTFVIEDSIEGWSDAIGVLISSYTTVDNKYNKYSGYRIDFDYSQIRPKGSYISGGFKAPGSDGLRNSIIKIETLLNNSIGIFKSIIAYDCIMYMSDAVLSGGVRRSATICLFSHDDHDMLNAKTGNWYSENPQRARSNNSVVLLRNSTSKEEFDKIINKVKEWGEPGFVWSDNEDIVYNPCVEISMIPKTKDGISGWQGCNLCEINGGLCDNEETFLKACEGAAILGTIQASYTDFKYIPSISRQIFNKEALLGCSLTGWMNNPSVLFNKSLQKKGAELIKKVNKEIAALIKINQSARTTTVKPSGNTSILLETASGIHGEHSRRYIRNIQVNKEEDEGLIFKNLNPKAVEESVWSANNTDYIFSFPIEVNPNSLFKKELLGVNQLSYVKIVRQNWIEYGTNEELCIDKKLRHNVSNTIIVDDWDKVSKYIYDNKEWFTGISLIDKTGDKDYNQAPFIAIYTPEEILSEYGNASIFASGLIVDGLHAFNNNLWLACDTLLNKGIDLSIETSENLLQRDWIRRAKKFSKNYFNNDYKRMTYCLKDVHNFKRWNDINNNLVTIDWKTINLKPSYVNIDTLGSISCAGGKCEIL